ncbi:19880_t:CDS:2, partial [Racocetra fulgida]
TPRIYKINIKMAISNTNTTISPVASNYVDTKSPHFTTTFNTHTAISSVTHSTQSPHSTTRSNANTAISPVVTHD